MTTGLLWALLLVSVHGDGLAVIPGYHSRDACVTAGQNLERLFHKVTKPIDGHLLSDGGPTLTYACVKVE